MTPQRQHNKPRISPKQFEVNARWTSLTNVEGWVHYRVCSRRRDGALLLLEMIAVCDRSVRFWLTASDLKDSEKWTTGWIDPTSGGE